MKRSDQMPIVIDDRELIALRALKERCGFSGKRFRVYGFRMRRHDVPDHNGTDVTDTLDQSPEVTLREDAEQLSVLICHGGHADALAAYLLHGGKNLRVGRNARYIVAAAHDVLHPERSDVTGQSLLW